MHGADNFKLLTLFIYLDIKCYGTARGDDDSGHKTDGRFARQCWRQLELQNVGAGLTELVGYAAELEAAVDGGLVGHR